MTAPIDPAGREAELRAENEKLREQRDTAQMVADEGQEVLSDVTEERDRLQRQVDAVRALHQPRTIDTTAYDCALGNCDHADECPTIETQVCAECFGRVEDFEPEVYTGDDLEWPCPTIAALDAVQPETET